MLVKLLPILLFLLSCSSPSWVIKKETNCTALIYIESLNKSSMTSKNHRKIEKEYNQLLKEMYEDCEDVLIRWIDLKQLTQE